MEKVPIDAEKIVHSCRSQPGLYIHVPFCSSICPFCPYNKIIYRKELAHRYFAALKKELEHYLAYLEGSFSSVYIGGGTPTLCLDELAGFMERIPIRGERAIEVLPSHADRKTVAKLLEMGITYVSLGIQSFDAGMLSYLQRPHSVEENYRALENTIGQFDCVDVDLIFDVAFQNAAVFLRDVETCFQKGVDQLSTYPLMRFGYTPFGKAKHDRLKEHEVLKSVQALAARYGYERRLVWTFNKHFSPTYTSITREFYVGLGAGAGTYTGEYFLLNHFSIERYIAKVESGQLPLARWIALGNLKAAVYYLFWQAYTGSINIKRFNELFPRASLLRTLLRLFSWTGHIEFKNELAVLSQKGYDLYHDLERWATYHFIEPLWENMQREHAWMAKILQARGRPSHRIWLLLMGAKQIAPDSPLEPTRLPGRL